MTHLLDTLIFVWRVDRMFAAQAIIGNLTLVTADKAFRTLAGLKLLSW